jgi:hypothetical protein
MVKNPDDYAQKGSVQPVDAFENTAFEPGFIEITEF